MKKKILLSLFVICLSLFVFYGISVSAATSGIYTYSVSNGEAKITDCSSSATGKIIIPDTLGGYPVTSIGNSAFRDCSRLTSITIPDGVTSIGSHAFKDCTGLTSVTIGNSVTSIGYSAFEYCSSLTSITIPDSVTSIGPSAFWGCSSITSITIPDSVTSIDDSTFRYCSSLTSITIPDSVTSIGGAAFEGCTGLTNVTIPDSVTSIGGSAFEDCTGLTNVTIGNSVTSIGDYAFYYCRSLTSITIPDSVTSIGRYAFRGCSSLTSITIPDSVTSIGGAAFEYCTGLTNITIPDSVTSIGYSAFGYCTGLTNVTIPDSVTSIGDYAFEDCIGLDTVYYNGNQTDWSEISISYGNDYLKNAERKYFYYVTFLDKEGNQISKKMYNIDGLIDISDIEEKFTIHLYTDVAYKNEYDLSTPISEDLTLYLHYVPNQYLSKFVDYDGDLIWEGLIDYGAVITPPENPTRERTQQYTYIFVGWTGFEEGITQTNQEMVFTATYDATVNQYTYKFLDNDDIVLKELMADYGTVIEVPENPADKDPYTFDYWEGYQDELILTDDITFTAIYKYKNYSITAEGLSSKTNVAYNSDFAIEPQTKDGYKFIGYFTEKNGKGMKITKENGESISVYNVVGDLMVYPYFYSNYINKIELQGTASAMPGDTITQSTIFATDKDAKYFSCTLKASNKLEVRDIKSESFELEQFSEIIDGNTHYYLFCIYNGDGNIPKNQEIIPFELIINVSENAEANEILAVEVLEDALLADDNGNSYSFTSIGKAEIKINPILTTSLEISGADVIDSPTLYKVAVLPENATNKEIEWSVSDEEVAAISQDGILTPKKRGVVTIRATAKDTGSVYAEKTVKIYIDVESIEISGADVIDSPTLYKVAVLPENATNKEIEWSVSDEDVATISQDGVLTPKKRGVVTIRATAKDGSGIFVEKEVTVKVYADIISLSSNIGVWDKDYNPLNKNYTVYVPKSATTIKLTAKHNGTLKTEDGKTTFPNAFARAISIPKDETILTLKYACEGYDDNTYIITIKKTSGIKTEVSEDKKTFTVTPINIENGKTVILSLYDGDKFVEMQSATYEGEVLTFVTDEIYTNAKVMVWDNLESLKAVCKPEIIE